jgi:hypothetical protein
MRSTWLSGQSTATRAIHRRFIPAPNRSCGLTSLRSCCAIKMLCACVAHDPNGSGHAARPHVQSSHSSLLDAWPPGSLASSFDGREAISV